MEPNTERHEFQAEARQLLDLVIHALYSHKDVFLRELVSNASDALDRLRFEALTQPELAAPDHQGEIRLEVDREDRTLTVHDNGIGMSRDELVANLGTIARSGTRELVQRLKQAKDKPPELIGQFGVGFYSAFMVADRVVVMTQRAGESAATRWESTGEGEYTLSEAEGAGHGTSITIHLKPVSEDDGLEDFTDEHVLSRVIRAYSDFVTYPIKLQVERGEGKDRKVEDRTLNSMKAIWMRPAAEVTDDEYNEFYKHVSHDWQEPLKRISLAAEGTFEWRALLFVPSRAPWDLFYPESRPGLQLYVKRVKIEEHCEHLLPRWLRFVKGVVDAPDLPLNVSREMLQHDRRLGQIRKRLTKKVIDALVELKDKEPEEYRKFWGEFGRAVKEGVAANDEHVKRLSDLLLFASSNDPTQLTGLADYLGRMKEGQEHIYFMTGMSRKAVEGSPQIEALRDAGIEVLFLVDPIDELLVQHVTEYEGKKLKSAGLGDVEAAAQSADTTSKEEREAQAKEHASLLEILQRKLADQVKEVRLSSRLRSSPACLVGGEGDMTPQMELLLRHAHGDEVPKLKRILELNPTHPVIVQLKEQFDRDRSNPAIEQTAELLYGQALLAEGSPLPDPAGFARRIADLMARVGGQSAS